MLPLQSIQMGSGVVKPSSLLLAELHRSLHNLLL